MDGHLTTSADWPGRSIRPYSMPVSKRTTSTARLASATVGVLACALLASAPAHADTADDAFLNSLGTAGLGATDPTDAVALGQSVCPMLSQPGQTAADAAAKVADTAGMSLGPATMFTGLAITAFCPGAVAALGNGQTPFPLGLLGF
ncbi:MAG: hypothetical protein QOE04_4206 [Mycobacterium sp.]|nr:hypothetical protein [Mycobacterium sp.]